VPAWGAVLNATIVVDTFARRLHAASSCTCDLPAEDGNDQPLLRTRDSGRLDAQGRLWFKARLLGLSALHDEGPLE